MPKSVILPQEKLFNLTEVPSTSATSVASRHHSVITAGLIHEIRNPLTNINLAVEMLHRLLTDDTQKAYLDMILRASGKVNLLITALVKDEFPEKVLPTKYSMHELIDEVLFATRDRLLLKNITLIRTYAKHDFFQPTGRPAMKIALTNIVINAIDAMPLNGQLLLHSESTKGFFSLQVQDNGCGISPENLLQIFEPYYTSKVNGLGIGLASTRDILKANKVGIDVDSIVGKGTRFTLNFANAYGLMPVKSKPSFRNLELGVRN